MTKQEWDMANTPAKIKERNEEVYDFCKDHYYHFDTYPNDCELSNGVVVDFADIMIILSEMQKYDIENQAK